MHKQNPSLKNWNVRQLLLVIAAVGCLIYSNTLNSSFQFDDHAFILNNPVVTQTQDVLLGKTSPTLHYKSRIIGFLSFSLNYQIHQDQVFGYHLVNLAIHITSAFLVFWLMLLLMRTPRLQTQARWSDPPLIALFVALIFVAHPVQTQAVTYIYQRLASLASLFYLLSICFYLRGRLGDGHMSGTRKWMVGSAVAALLGMLTKEIVFTLPVVIVLLEWYVFYSPDQKSSGAKSWSVKRLWPLIFLLAIPVMFAFDMSRVFSPRVLRSGSHELITSPVYLMTQFNVIVHYIRLLFVPIGQNVDYDFAVTRSLFLGLTWLNLLVLLAILRIGLKSLRTNPFIAIGIFWFFITLAVESSIIPIRYVIWEHRLYLPMIGFAMVLAGLIFDRKMDTKKILIVILVLTAGLGTLTYFRNQVWRTEINLWEDVARKSPAKPYVHYALASAYQKQELYEPAQASYLRALELYPEDQKYKDILWLEKVYRNLTILYDKTGQAQKSQVAYDKTMQYRREIAEEYLRYGIRYYESGRYESALAALNKAVEELNRDSEVYLYLGRTYQRLNQWPSARKNYTKALELAETIKDEALVSELNQILQSVKE